MSALHLRAVVLPEGEQRDLWVDAEGHVRHDPDPTTRRDAETVLEGGWLLPGLVDAHCHVGLDEHGGVDEATTEAQKMMKQLAAGGGMPGMPGMPGMGIGKKSKGKAQQKRKVKGGRSGNPAKRALEQRQAEARASGEAVPGMPALPADFELPDELKGLLPPEQR